MKITVERFDWTRHEPDLVVLVGDPYQDFTGTPSGALGERVTALAEGFTSGKLSREVGFSLPHEGTGRLVNYLYFHTSLEKGFTAVETLKTFLTRALRLASETGLKKVGLCLRGPDGEGLLEQLVEGALVGTFKFNEFLKEKVDRFEDMELIFYPPTPAPSAPAEPAAAEPAAEPESAQAETVAETRQPVEQVEEPLSEAAEEALSEPAADAAGSEASEESSSSEQEAATSEPSEESTDVAEATLEAEGEASGEASAEEPGQTPPTVALAAPETVQPVEESATADVADWSEEEKQAWQARDEAAVAVGGAFGRGVNLARTLIAQPASVCTPTYLAKMGESLARQYGFGYQAFGIKELEKQGFVGHLAVGGGSANSPKMFELCYEPPSPSNVHLVLVGKGVTFDTGGISIKPADKMHLMIGDMSGAAAVLGTMDILGQLRPSIKVSAVIVSAENSPDGKSFRPGDILKYKNGLSVHIENTDAEGRLLLADGLIRAGELGATHIVDIATLTGACARALGPSFTGIMGANRKLINAITRAGGIAP
jgi:leucyl aminopeptidase